MSDHGGWAGYRAAGGERRTSWRERRMDRQAADAKVRGFFSDFLWVKSYILYLLLGNVEVKLYFYSG
jgi:hypothetical protein